MTESRVTAFLPDEGLASLSDTRWSSRIRTSTKENPASKRDPRDHWKKGAIRAGELHLVEDILASQLWLNLGYPFTLRMSCVTSSWMRQQCILPLKHGHGELISQCPERYGKISESIGRIQN